MLLTVYSTNEQKFFRGVDDCSFYVDSRAFGSAIDDLYQEDEAYRDRNQKLLSAAKVMINKVKGKERESNRTVASNRTVMSN